MLTMLPEYSPRDVFGVRVRFAMTPFWPTPSVGRSIMRKYLFCSTICLVSSPLRGKFVTFICDGGEIGESMLMRTLCVSCGILLVNSDSGNISVFAAVASDGACRGSGPEFGVG